MYPQNERKIEKKRQKKERKESQMALTLSLKYVYSQRRSYNLTSIQYTPLQILGAKPGGETSGGAKRLGEKHDQGRNILGTKLVKEMV